MLYLLSPDNLFFRFRVFRLPFNQLALNHSLNSRLSLSSAYLLSPDNLFLRFRVFHLPFDQLALNHSLNSRLSLSSAYLLSPDNLFLRFRVFHLPFDQLALNHSLNSDRVPVYLSAAITTKSRRQVSTSTEQDVHILKMNREPLWLGGSPGQSQDREVDWLLNARRMKLPLSTM